MEEIWVIERIEEGIALCEKPNRTHIPLALAELPEGAREGDCLVWRADGSLRLDAEETSRRRRRNAELFDKLKKKK